LDAEEKKAVESLRGKSHFTTSPSILQKFRAKMKQMFGN
jgi:hypothetical protein